MAGSTRAVACAIAHLARVRCGWKTASPYQAMMNWTVIALRCTRYDSRVGLVPFLSLGLTLREFFNSQSVFGEILRHITEIFPAKFLHDHIGL